MARILKMPEPKQPSYCPACGSRKLEFLGERDLDDITSFRYRCANGHVSITAIEHPSRAAASGE